MSDVRRFDYFEPLFPELFRDCHPLNVSCPPGWAPQVSTALSAIHQIAPETRIDCIKQKFGHLRIYVTHPVYAIIDECAQHCARVCERCGKSSDTVTTKCDPDGRWIYTSCEPCRRAR